MSETLMLWFTGGLVLATVALVVVTCFLAFYTKKLVWVGEQQSKAATRQAAVAHAANFISSQHVARTTGGFDYGYVAPEWAREALHIDVNDDKDRRL